jgi:DNA repair exonuclease SbcCD nuclease subunit
MKEDNVALTLVHTADWHLGMRFRSFREEDERELMRARLAVIERILGVADRHQADAVLAAGDLFDEPKPDRKWWEGLADVLARRSMPGRPVLLLPGNHDPLIPESVWEPMSPFRRKLPAHVHVVDRDDFSYALKEGAVLHAAPCRSSAGQKDLALSLPARELGDERIRVGLVHGSTFDMPNCQTNFPIAQDAAVKRGFDYLATGDTHGFRVVPPGARVPAVYPGAPEPTSFADKDPGHVALVFITQHRRVRLEKERVARWYWEVCRVGGLEDLRRLASRADLAQRVLQLTVEATLPAAEYEEAERILLELGGTEAAGPKAGILQLDRSRLELDTRDIEAVFANMPEAVREAVRRLKQEEHGERGEVARRALYHLFTLAGKVA